LSTLDIDSLPWDAFEHSQGEIPWNVLEQFADALVASPSLWERLREPYRACVKDGWRRGTYVCIYVPAIFAMAGPRLDPEVLEPIARFLADELAHVNEYDDLLAQVLEAALGSLGPAAVRPALAALEGLDTEERGWVSLWDVLGVAATTDDEQLRGAVEAQARRVLRRVCRGKIDPLAGSFAAWVLARMGCTVSRPLIEQAWEETHCADIRDALGLMDGTLSFTPNPEQWERPLREWVESHWRWLRQHYEGIEEERRREDLLDAFRGSDEFRALPDDVAGNAPFIIVQVLDAARTYCDASVERLDVIALEEVLLDVFPRKVTGSREMFEKVAPSVAAFLMYLASEGLLADGEAMAETVTSWHERIVAEGMDPSNWGFAKSVAMSAIAEGVDVADPEAYKRFMRDLSHRRARQREAHQPLVGGLAAAESVSSPPPVGRNDPCPCGSGRKYKKCCMWKPRNADGGHA